MLRNWIQKVEITSNDDFFFHHEKYIINFKLIHQLILSYKRYINIESNINIIIFIHVIIPMMTQIIINLATVINPGVAYFWIRPFHILNFHVEQW